MARIALVYIKYFFFQRTTQNTVSLAQSTGCLFLCPKVLVWYPGDHCNPLWSGTHIYTSTFYHARPIILENDHHQNYEKCDPSAVRAWALRITRPMHRPLEYLVIIILQMFGRLNKTTNLECTLMGFLPRRYLFDSFVPRDVGTGVQYGVIPFSFRN